MDKLRVILVDDEMLIRKLIRMKMETTRLNLEIVGEYSNSFAAMQEIEEVKPDIVISDICMPEEDGIDFSEKCVKLYPNVKVILVTGYDDFDYARRSIKAGVFEYLLKPVQAEELNASLERAAEAICTFRRTKEKQKELLNEVEENLPALRELYINQLLIQEEEGDVEGKLCRYGISLERDRNYTVQIGIFVIKEGFGQPDLILQVLEEAKEFFDSDECILVLKDFWNRIVVISYQTGIPFEECLDILADLLKRKYGCHLCLGISETAVGWKKLNQGYLSALECIQKKHSNKEELREETAEVQGWKTIVEFIENGCAEEAEALAGKLISEISGNIGEVRKKVIARCQKLYIDLDVSQTRVLFHKELKWCQTFRHLASCLENIITELTVKKKIARQEKNSDLAARILNYMQNHIEDEELGLNYLAAEFSVSSSYLSRMLKLFTSKNYGEILSELRLLRMLELINTTDMKDCDIGRQIGIRDPHYLSIWFKKVSGVSVTEYRKQAGLKTE